MNNTTDIRTVTEKAIEIGSLVAVSLVGIPGNVLVLCTIMSVKKLRTVTNSFLVNLCVADLLVCAFVIPFLIPLRLHRRLIFPKGMCVFQAFTNQLTVQASLFFLAGVSANRLVSVRWPIRYKAIFTPKTAAVMHSSLWILSATCALPPIVGWGQYTYDNVRDNCLFDRSTAPSFSIFFASFGILLPLTLTLLAYFMILMTFMKSRSGLRRQQQRQTKGISGEEIRLTKNLFVVWIVFFLCWAPMNAMLLLDPLGKISRPYYMAAIWLLLCNSCVNPFIYGLSNRTFREGYLMLLRRCSRRQNVVDVRPFFVERLNPRPRQAWARDYMCKKTTADRPDASSKHDSISTSI